VQAVGRDDEGGEAEKGQETMDQWERFSNSDECDGDGVVLEEEPPASELGEYARPTTPVIN